MNTTLQRDVFKRTIPVLAARVPASKTGFLLKSDVMKKSLMDLPKVRSVLRDPHDDLGRLVLLNVSEHGTVCPLAGGPEFLARTVCYAGCAQS
jgi:tRNA (guanine37-N1)-methyltransferase